MSPIQDHHQIVTNLKRWFSEQSDTVEVELIETHISSVLLAGSYAYKIKKPIDLGFLDFSTLDRRRFSCEEEIRLNSRLAKEVYLDVVDITGCPEQPSVEGHGAVIEHAVRMRRIEGALLAQQPERLSEKLADELAQQLADFHASIEVTSILPPYGTPEQVLLPMQQNFAQIRTLSGVEFDQRLSLLQNCTLDEYRRLEQRLGERRAEGYIRECHGDLHLGNIALEGDRLILFDGIEFNPALRWIDTMSELAFLLMDIEEKGLLQISRRVLNSYLEFSGDYQGLDVLRFYQLYRAMVRAKVLAIRLHQSDVAGDEKALLQAEFATYLDTAQRYTQAGAPALLITHGFSGCGKSTISGELTKNLPLVRVRSDVERKRLAGLAATSDSGSPQMGGIYSSGFSEKTYGYLLSLAQSLLLAGYAVIVDAAFLKCDQRRLFAEIASKLDFPFLILDIQAPKSELRKRVMARQNLGSDPSEANLEVLNMQFDLADDLTEQELQRWVLVVNQESAGKRNLINRIQYRLAGQ